MAAAPFTMNGGNEHHSYSINSTYQRGATDSAKELINTAIVDHLDDALFTSQPKNNVIRVVDMGCATGPNTFVAVKNIIQSLHRKQQLVNDHSTTAEFQVFLNDHVSNDFNTLFAQSVSHQDCYHLAGVPGSFHGRLFPAGSLHVVHTSYALQWLARVPDPVLDTDSPAWNKGRISYFESKEDVKWTLDAYREQFGKDLGRFLNARAEEVVPGGLILVLLPARSNETSHSQVSSMITYHLLGSCLMDMAHKGLISEEKVDSLNIPIYFASPEEVEAAVEANGSFRIVMMECTKQGRVPGTDESKARAITSHIRAGMEGLIKLHFEEEDDDDDTSMFPMDELFHSFEQKLLSSGFFHAENRGEQFNLFVVLKRKD